MAELARSEHFKIVTDKDIPTNEVKNLKETAEFCLKAIEQEAKQRSYNLLAYGTTHPEAYE